MIIENCPKCKGTHIGSYECPIFCICCANGNDLPEGEYCRACGRENRVPNVGLGWVRTQFPEEFSDEDSK